MIQYPRLLHATFLLDKRMYNVTGKVVPVQEHDMVAASPVRCSMQPRHVLQLEDVRTASGMVVHPIEGSGLHRAALEALTKEAELHPQPKEPT